MISNLTLELTPFNAVPVIKTPACWSINDVSFKFEYFLVSKTHDRFFYRFEA